MVGDPNGGVGVYRVEPLKVQLYLAGTGLTVEDAVYEGLRGSPTSRIDRGEFTLEPGGWAAM